MALTLFCSATSLFHELQTILRMQCPLWQKYNLQKRSRAIDYSSGKFYELLLLKYLIVTKQPLPSKFCHAPSTKYKPTPHATPSHGRNLTCKNRSSTYDNTIVSFVFFICRTMSLKFPASNLSSFHSPNHDLPSSMDLPSHCINLKE